MFLTFCLVVFCQSNAKDVSKNKGCVCTPIFLCDDENAAGGILTINDLIDPRIKSDNKCLNSFEVCCKKTKSGESFITSCGRRNFNGLNVRLLDNTNQNNEVKYGEFPWMTAVLRKEEATGRRFYLGGAVLLSHRVVLTAAHKVVEYVGSRKSRLFVRLGEWDSQAKSEPHPHKDVYVKDIIIHPDYDNFDLLNDFALLVLEDAVELTPYINTICLPTGRGIYDHNKCVATGWGKDGFNETSNYQNILKHVQLPLLRKDSCERSLRRTRLGPTFELHKSFVCAGGRSGQDTCSGDGGSPLICPLLEDPGTYQVVGLVAWGIGCGGEGVPGVYANVNDENVIGWILTKMYPHLVRN